MNNIPNLTPEQIQALMLQQQILQNQMIQEANNPRGAFYQRLNMGNIPTGQGNQQMQNVNPNLIATNNFEGIPMTYGINYYTGEVDKNVKRPNVNATNSMELSEINPEGTEKARLYNAHLNALVESKKMIRKINND